MPSAPHNRPEGELTDPGGMHGGAQLRTMVGRRTDKTLAQVVAEVAGPCEAGSAQSRSGMTRIGEKHISSTVPSLHVM